MQKTLRKSLFAFLFVVALIAVILPLKMANAQDLCTRVEGIPNTPIYRAYFSYNGEHLFTYAKDEVDGLVANHGWKDEGVAWHAPRLGQPVYRLYDAAGNHDHLYTMDTNEVNILTTQRGWTQDNGGSPIFNSGGNIPIYRVFNPSTGAHHLTTDANEYEVLGSSGWNKEGVALYATDPNGAVDYPVGGSSIENVDGTYVIQADVNLQGAGSGYHAKIGLNTPQAAISFGLQFDQAGLGGYQNATGFIVENIYTNAPGEQAYQRVNLAATGQTFRLMLSLNPNGRCTYYINGTEMGHVDNPNIVGSGRIDPRVEGSARLNGDSVNANFSNIKLKNTAGGYDANKAWKGIAQDTNPGIHSDLSGFDSARHISIAGTVSGLGANEDWDSAYNKVSGVVSFYDH